jgi:hypothetical protein
VSLHNRAKHWVDDHKQRRHAPIDIADIFWKTQWWPHRQFAFFLGISEASAANSRGRAKGVAADQQLKFWKALALCMLENTLDDDVKIVRTVERCLRVWGGDVAEHELKTRPLNTGKWLGHYWKNTQQKYQKLKCYNGCDPQARVRTYCACNKGLVPMCSPCHAAHCTLVIG